MENFLQEALILRRYGWSVFPIQKKVSVASWGPLQYRLARDREIGEMFRRPHDGVGAVCGSASGWLSVRDFDDLESYTAWASKYPQLALILPTVRTYRGFHVYCRNIEEENVGIKFGDGELRASCKQIVVLPPTLHPKGVSYSWVGGFTPPLSDFPWLSLGEIGFLDGPPQNRKKTQRQESEDQTESREEQDLSINTSSVSLSCLSDSDWNLINTVIARCLPTGLGQRRDRIFDLCRGLLGLIGPADAKPDALEGIFKVWFKWSLPIIGTKDYKTSWKDFQELWRYVRVPLGRGAFDKAMRRAVSGQLPAAPIDRQDEPTRKLFALCRHLANIAKPDPFFLSCRKAQEVCGFSGNKTPARRLEEMVQAGFLSISKAGVGGGRNRIATRYFFKEEADVRIF